MLIRNSALDLVFLIRPVSSSIASTGFMSLSTRRKIQTRRSSSASISSSSRRVPERLTSMAGQTALVDEAPVEVQLHVARALELFENHFVHTAAGVDQRGGENRQAAAFLNVASCSEETLRLVQRRLASTPPERILPECGALRCCRRGPDE